MIQLQLSPETPLGPEMGFHATRSVAREGHTALAQCSETKEYFLAAPCQGEGP